MSSSNVCELTNQAMETQHLSCHPISHLDTLHHVRWISASARITKLVRVQSPSTSLCSHHHGLQVHLTACWISALMCTSILTELRHPCASGASKGSRLPASVPCSDWKNGSFRFHTFPETQRAASWRSKMGPVPVNLQVLPGFAIPVGSNLWFCISGCSIYGHIQISYC